MIRSYSSGEVCRLSSVPIQTLHWWAKNAVLTPSINDSDGTGSRRRWSFADVVAAAVLHRLALHAPGWLQHVGSGVQKCLAEFPEGKEPKFLFIRGAEWDAPEGKRLLDYLRNWPEGLYLLIGIRLREACDDVRAKLASASPDNATRQIPDALSPQTE